MVNDVHKIDESAMQGVVDAVASHQEQQQTMVETASILMRDIEAKRVRDVSAQRDMFVYGGAGRACGGKRAPPGGAR